MIPIDIPNTLEKELGEAVKDSIKNKEDKDKVRERYDIYMDYLREDGLNIDKKLRDEVRKKYVEYIKYE